MKQSQYLKVFRSCMITVITSIIIFLLIDNYMVEVTSAILIASASIVWGIFRYMRLEDENYIRDTESMT